MIESFLKVRPPDEIAIWTGVVMDVAEANGTVVFKVVSRPRTVEHEDVDVAA